MPNSAIAAFIAILGFAISARAEIPLTWAPTGHVLAPAFVNGGGPYPFMVDTGADESAVYAWFAAAHKLPKGHASKLDGATGAQSETTTRLAALTLDGQTIRRVQADTIPDRSDGVRIAGIVGVDLMINHLTVLDLGCGTASLLPPDTDPAKVAGAGAVFVRAGSVKGGKQLTLPASINGALGLGVLDTGARSTIVNRAFAKAAGLDPESGAFVAGPPTRGAVGETKGSRVGPVGTVQFGGIVRSGVVARVLDLPVFEDMGFADRPTVNLGIDLLRDVRLTIDYRHRKLWLAPSACHAPAAGG